MYAPYDYYSIMHPPYDWFSNGYVQPVVFKNKHLFTDSYYKHVTVETLQKAYRYEIGSRTGLSYYNQLELNLAFKCRRDVNGNFLNGNPF